MHEGKVHATWEIRLVTTFGSTSASESVNVMILT